MKRSPALARCPVILSEGLAGAGEGARGPWCLREPLRQTQPVAHRGVTLLRPTGRRERSRHPEKQRVLLIPEGSSPGAPERRWQAAALASTGVPVPLRLPGSGAGDPRVPSAQASAYQGSSSLEETLENLSPGKWLCVLRGRARRGAWVLPPRRGLRWPEGETAPAPG